MQNPGGEEVKLGRPQYEDRGDIVEKNGFTVRQNEWLRKEAKAKGLDTTTYIRMYPIDWWIKSVEATRTGSVATQEEDQAFEELVKKSNHKRSRKSKRSKSK